MSATHPMRNRWIQRISVLGVAGVVVLTAGSGPTTTTPAAYQGGLPAAPVVVAKAPSVPGGPVLAPAVDSAPLQQPSAVAGARRAAVGPASDYPGEVTAISTEAIAAYQRAATVIDAAAPCHLSWPVLAAIGRVESDNGTTDPRGRTHRVTPSGVVRPAIVGTPLNGKGGLGTVSDTDAGRLDHNTRYDAPIGPMALMPATWQQVAVDADGDGVRNPQDLDDAALGAAIVLCADGHDLRRPQVLRQELQAYQDARGFAGTVMALAERYAKQQTAVPDLLPETGVVIPMQMPQVCGCSGHGGAVVHVKVHHYAHDVSVRPNGSVVSADAPHPTGPQGAGQPTGSGDQSTSGSDGGTPAAPGTTTTTTTTTTTGTATGTTTGTTTAGTTSSASQDPTGQDGGDQSAPAAPQPPAPPAPAPPAPAPQPPADQPPADRCAAPDGTVLDITDPASPTVVDGASAAGLPQCDPAEVSDSHA